jgi:3-dehydroquinate dehydratase / shikimate dehydrogenase
MGERGVATRLLAPKLGGFLTFGALAAGSESAPGQPTVQQLRDLYRLPQQTPGTKAR